MLKICQALFLVVAYVHIVGALSSTDSAKPPKAIMINATTMNGSGPVFVPAGSNLTIIGISAYETAEQWLGGLAKITELYEPLATDALRNIQLNDNRANVVEYAKQKLADDALLTQPTPPFFPSPAFHVLFHDLNPTGPLKRLSRNFDAYASRWKGATCNPKPIDPKTNQPYAFECYNYTLIGARGEDSGWPAFLLTPREISDLSGASLEKVKNDPASLRLGPLIRVIEAPQRVEWETPRGDYPYQLNANATLSCIVIADWRDEFNVSVLLVGQDGSQQDITGVFQQVNETSEYRNASIYARVQTQAGAIMGQANFTETNNLAFVLRRHAFILRSTRVLDEKMDNKTLICQAVSKRFPSINASDSLFFRLVANQSALLAYHSNRSGVVFKHCPHANNLSLDLTKVNTFNWRCCVELGGSGNADQMLLTNRDLFWGFNVTNSRTGQSAFVNTPTEMLAQNAYIEFKEPQIERGFASRACFELYFKSLQYTKDISFTFGMRRPGSPKWHNTTSYQFTQGTQKDAAFNQSVTTKSGALGAAKGGLVPLAAALLLAVALAH